MSYQMFGQAGDESLNERGTMPTMNTLCRPNYDKLRAEYQIISAKMLPKKTLNRKQAWKWAHAQHDFEDALFELQHRSGLGTVILNPDDTRKEHVRLQNAVICLQDYTRLYKEIIMQPPPQGLVDIKEQLIKRLKELDNLYNVKGRQFY